MTQHDLAIRRISARSTGPSTSYRSHPTQVTEWRRQLLERAADVLGRKFAQAVDLAPLHEKIGRQVLELNF